MKISESAWERERERLWQSFRNGMLSQEIKNSSFMESPYENSVYSVFWVAGFSYMDGYNDCLLNVHETVDDAFGKQYRAYMKKKVAG